MGREIGSEFWGIPQGGANTLFPPDTAWFLSGRWAMDFVLGDILAGPSVSCTAALPSWCCETMIRPFLDRGFEVCFYPVLPDPAGGLRADFSQAEGCGVLLVMDYFGYAARTPPAGFSGVVIRDATHSLFTGLPEDGDYVFGSLRKWAGFWTGGWAWKRAGGFQSVPPVKADPRYTSLRRRAMEEKLAYLEGRRPDKGYLAIFNKAEALLDDEEIERAGAEGRDIAAAECLNVERLRQKRRENTGWLLAGVSRMALFPRLGEADCPLFVPILVPDGKRDALRRFLIEREIYCPIHWPLSSFHKLTDEERQIYEEELSLVCDQRYDREDMKRTLDAIEDFFASERDKGDI